MDDDTCWWGGGGSVASYRRQRNGGIHHRALKGHQNTAVGKAVRPPPAGTDALPMAEWIMPTPPRG
ncbi:MAG: hypothetical protein K6A95_06830, partial [Bacteroidales bacterium]|nr:hypothetical protein [Bacteroidales bacterium]